MGHAYSNQIGSVSLYLSRCLCLVSGLVVSTEQSGRLSGIGVGRGDAGFGGVCPVRALCCNTPLWPLTLCSRETTWARCGQSAGHASPGYLLFFFFLLLYCISSSGTNRVSFLLFFYLFALNIQGGGLWVNRVLPIRIRV